MLGTLFSVFITQYSLLSTQHYHLISLSARPRKVDYSCLSAGM